MSKQITRIDNLLLKVVDVSVNGVLLSSTGYLFGFIKFNNMKG